MKAGDIIVANTGYKASNLTNASYTEKYSIGNSRAYTVTADGDVELAFKKPDSKTMHYFYGLYAYTHNVTGTAVGDLNNGTDYMAATSTYQTLKPGESYHYNFINYNTGGNGNWDNYILSVKDASDADKIVLRADNFEVVKWSNTGCTNNFVWDNFASEMNGATVDMTVNYSASNVLTMSATITTASNLSWTYSYDSSTAGVNLSDNIKIALSVSKSWLDIVEEGMASSYVVTIPSSGYGSLAVAYGLNFAGIDGLTAFVVTGITKDAVTLTSVNELPASSGVILKGTAGTTYSIPVKADAAYTGTNKLKAAVEATDIKANEAYILQGGEFHLVTAASTVPAGKAYLLAKDVPASARSLSFMFGDEASGINDVVREMQSGEFYNLSGQRVAAPKSGFYIVNGKKVIIK